MEKKNSCARAGFSTILWGILAISLCAAPCVAADDVTVPAGKEWDINYTISGNLNVYGTANLLTSAYIEQFVNAWDNSVVNIKGGEVVYWIEVYQNANITVYGKYFKVNGVALDPIPDQVTFTDGSGTLFVKYEDDTTANLQFYSFYDEITINLVNTAAGGPQEVQIDIKPGSDLNPINPGSNGLIPVAILTTDDFNAADVDPATVTLAGAEVAVRGKAEKLMARLEDVDGDGDLDLLVQVETQSDGALWESGTVTLTGETVDGVQFEGTDEVIIVPAAE